MFKQVRRIMAYRIPLFDLNFGQEEKKLFWRYLDLNGFSMGDKTTEFERDFRKNK
jgi:hypothetical protein